MDIMTVGLDRMAQAKNYNRWVFQKIKPFLGQRILEVGCGIGNMTQFFLNKELVVAIDIQDNYLNILKSKFSKCQNLHLLKCDIREETSIKALKGYECDTVVCLNLLEHIENDRSILKNIYQILARGGNAILLVPAYQWLYGTMDRELGHHRRYNRKGLEEKLEKRGFEVLSSFWLNFLGIWGWYFNGRVLKKKVVPKRQLLLFNRFVPLLSRMERWVKPPLGMSLVCVGHKR